MLESFCFSADFPNKPFEVSLFVSPPPICPNRPAAEVLVDLAPNIEEVDCPTDVLNGNEGKPLIFDPPKPPPLVVVDVAPKIEDDGACPKVDGCPNIEDVVVEAVALGCDGCPNIDEVAVVAEDKAIGCAGCPNIEEVVTDDTAEAIGWEGCPNIDGVTDDDVG